MPLVTTNLITARRQIKAFLNRPLNEIFFSINDPLLTWRDNGFYDEAGHYLILRCKLQGLIVKITIAGQTPHIERAINS